MHHYNGKAVLTKTGKAMIGDYGALQAEMFDGFFIALDYCAYERFPIDYDDADIRHFLGVIQTGLAIGSLWSISLLGACRSTQSATGA